MYIKKLLLSLTMLTTFGISPAFANDANHAFDQAISNLNDHQLAEFLGGAPASNIQLPNGTSLADVVKSSLSQTGPLEYRAMPPCTLGQAFLSTAALVPCAVRGFCNVPADAKAVALSIYALPVVSKDRPGSTVIGAFPGDETSGLSNAGAIMRIPYIEDSAQGMTIVRICETCGVNDFILRASFSTTVDVGVLGYFVPAQPGAVGAQGPQGIQGATGATGPRGQQGVAVTATAICGMGNVFNSVAGGSGTSCATLCGGASRVLASASTVSTTVPCTISAVGGATCQQLATTTREGLCCACSAPLAP